MKKQTVVLTAIFVLVLLVSGLGSYLLFGRRTAPQTPDADNVAAQEETTTVASQNTGDTQNSARSPVSQSAQPDRDVSDQPLPNQRAAPSPAQQANGGGSLFTELFGAQEIITPQGEPESVWVIAARITVRFLLAVLLATLLAYRPRRRTSMFQRNPYVAQTQILLAVVASALMMVVGDSAARAFGIFAAASLVRFRTNISDPKEITVLLVSLAIGLATGVGHWEVAIVLCLFVLVTLWVLEHYEPSQAFRSMEVTITTRNVDGTNRVLRRVLRKHRLNFELREIDREDADEPVGRIVYHVNVSLLTSTDTLSSEIFSLDPENIDSIVWSQKKVPSIYT